MVINQASTGVKVYASNSMYSPTGSKTKVMPLSGIVDRLLAGDQTTLAMGFNGGDGADSMA